MPTTFNAAVMQMWLGWRKACGAEPHVPTPLPQSGFVSVLSEDDTESMSSAQSSRSLLSSLNKVGRTARGCCGHLRVLSLPLAAACGDTRPCQANAAAARSVSTADC